MSVSSTQDADETTNDGGGWLRRELAGLVVAVTVLVVAAFVSQLGGRVAVSGFIVLVLFGLLFLRQRQLINRLNELETQIARLEGP
ncbi:MAG: hypothetical protein ABEJ48_09830 [Halobacteriales archaeon]